MHAKYLVFITGANLMTYKWGKHESYETTRVQYLYIRFCNITAGIVLGGVHVYCLPETFDHGLRIPLDTEHRSYSYY